MLVDFFLHLRSAGLPVSITELLTLLEALQKDTIAPALGDFYFLARTCLVKDETRFDRYDRAFAHYVHGIEARAASAGALPEEWFRERLRRALDPAELARLQALGWERLMEQLQQRLHEQDGAHHGGSKWIGSRGTSPFGHGGIHPQGVRIGGPSNGGRTAVRVWEARRYRDYDDHVELGTRNIQVALRRLRRFARAGTELELDLPDTIAATARNAGQLDLRLVPQRLNRIKVLLLLDVGGSMDAHVRGVEQLFSAARAQFRNLQSYYFHNCVYDQVWSSNRRRHAERCDTVDLLRRHRADTRLVFVGDATMSPYEILQPWGAIEGGNEEPGATWLQRLVHQFPRVAWINPEPEGLWTYRPSVGIIRELLGGRMYPLTLEGLTRSMRMLARGP